jgi:hypothetical protein
MTGNEQGLHGITDATSEKASESSHRGCLSQKDNIQAKVHEVHASALRSQSANSPIAAFVRLWAA